MALFTHRILLEILGWVKVSYNVKVTSKFNSMKLQGGTVDAKD